MRGKIQKIANKATQVLGSKYCFLGVIILFVLQAMWIAFSFRYPMLFDERYHFGLIEHFSHQWLPWINNQPTNLDQYGALGRNPYLLYHYLMSFPFRVIDIFTDNLAVQVISIRLINIGLFAGGLVVFARLFKTMEIQSIFRNIALLFFVLLPITPFVAATVNYDNAIFLLTALFMLIGVRIIQSQKIQWHNYALLVLIGMVGSLIKVSFLPILVAGLIFVFTYSFINYKNKLVHNSIQSFKTSGLWLKIVILVPIVIIGFLFAERFAVNVFQYHKLAPSCEKQMVKDRCLANPIEARGDSLKKSKKGVPVQAPNYTTTWFNNMVYTLLYSGSSVSNGGGSSTAPPLPIVYLVVFIGSIVSFAAFFYGFRILKKLSGFWLLTAIISVYLISLFYTTASAYYTYYVAMAIQGRYLLPLLPVIMVFALLGINYAMQKRHLLKLSVLVVVFMLFLNGAGDVTHIMRSNDSWNWDNRTVRQVNDGARNLLTPFIKEWWYDR